MSKLYIEEDTTAGQLFAVDKFKFHDSSVYFAWSTCNCCPNYLYMHDIDDKCTNILADGDFGKIHNYNVDVPRLIELFKGHEVFLTDLHNCDEIALEDIPNE